MSQRITTWASETTPGEVALHIERDSLLVNMGLSADEADQLALELAAEAHKARKARSARAMTSVKVSL